jgi:hypothetical protein
MIFLNFHRILAIENVKKYLVLALLIFDIAFWLYIANQKKAAHHGCSRLHLHQIMNDVDVGN